MLASASAAREPQKITTSLGTAAVVTPRDRKHRTLLCRAPDVLAHAECGTCREERGAVNVAVT